MTKALNNVQSKRAVHPFTESAPCVTASSEPGSFCKQSPIQKFRAFPKKPFSVSDLTSGAWCELQYEYTLTRLPGGRRTRTAAMKQGSKMHQALEDEVHTTVRVDIVTKEDGFGLRLWNLIQGLRTLRESGLTRELEVWGTIDGNLVNGIIDSVSYTNPNPDFEEELSSQESQMDHQKAKIVDYFPSKETGDESPKIYLADVKTRGSLLPVSNALLRPAKIQLLLYHRFLGDMAAGRLDYHNVFRRYGLDADDAFSDTFVAQIAGLEREIFVDAPTSSITSENNAQNPSSSDASSGPDLLRYNTLRELVPLVQREIKLTFPQGEDTLGHMMRVQYLYRNDGRELDVHDFPVSRKALGTYLDRYMSWCRGEREARGVDIEEAFKCRNCEFAEGCGWRQGIHDSIVQKSQKRRGASGGGDVGI